MVSHFYCGGGVFVRLWAWYFTVFSISVQSSSSVTFRKHSIFMTFPTRNFSYAAVHTYFSALQSVSFFSSKE